MQYTVVHSKDPYLLARLATDLQMSGVYHNFYNELAHPFYEKCPSKWVQVVFKYFNFHPHDCFGDPIRHELTSRNYIKVLTQILEPCLTTS